MNTMLYRVVNEGTGGMANLDFTNVAGKTGTSTGPKDAWFMGFTGKYVAGVWLGNDDNHAMRAGVTGGHQAAPVWHDLMTVAHTDMNIPTIPGLQPHPRQVEEQQRLAALKAAQVAAGLEPAKAADNGKPESLMPDKTRAVLKSLTTALRKAEGGPGDPATPPSSTDSPQDPAKEKTPGRADRRATLFESLTGAPTAASAQSAQ
jgi:penicillin-binding protein 1A